MATFIWLATMAAFLLNGTPLRTQHLAWRTGEPVVSPVGFIGTEWVCNPLVNPKGQTPTQWETDRSNGPSVTDTEFCYAGIVWSPTQAPHYEVGP